MENRSRITPYFLVILSTLLITSFGCSDSFFEQKAGDRITPDQHYKSEIDAEVAVYGAEMPLKDIAPRLIMLDGLRSDMMDVTPFADAYLKEINEQMITKENPFANPADLYKVVINCNEVLANIDKVMLRDRTFDAYYDHYFKGALISLRSWAYLQIVRTFGQAAYIPDNMTSLPANLEQSYLSKQVMLDTLINQLTPYIQDNTVGTQYVEIRFGNLPNTKAMLGEVYLEANDYANAATYLKMACESYNNTTTLLKVERSYQNAGWSNIFLNAEGVSLENLMVIPYSSNEAQNNILETWIGHSNNYMVKPSAVLVDSFMAQQPSIGTGGDLWRGLGITFSVDTLADNGDGTFVTEPYITKYEIDKSDPFSSDIIFSRAADIHLLLAEALNRLGDANSRKYALMLLNQGVNKENPKPAAYSKWAQNLGIRGRVSLKSRIVPAYMLDQDSITNTIEDFIMSERAMELAYEGHRWNDLVRVAERRNDPAYLADKVAAKFEGTAMYDQVHEKLMDPANWYLK